MKNKLSFKIVKIQMFILLAISVLILQKYENIIKS